MTDTSLSIRAVSKRYGSVEALRSLSLDVQPNELLVLVGPSGCGKTTLLRLIAGLDDPDDGDIILGGRSLVGVDPGERDVAMVFQSYALFPHMTVRENVAFGLRARKIAAADADARVASAADVLELGALLERRPRELSGGERQRVALARALVREPALFLLDEPLSNLDAQLRVRTRAEIVRLQARLGTAMVYVTHDQIEALGMGHRVGVLHHGELRQVGTPRDVYERPADLFVATFIGSPPMNVLNATVEDGHLVGEGWSLPVPASFADVPSQVVLGVRPEHVHVVGSRWSMGANKPDGTIAARLDVVEPIGDQALLVLDVGGAQVIARVEPSFHAAPQDRLEVWFDPAGLHLFDPESERAIPRRVP